MFAPDFSITRLPLRMPYTGWSGPRYRASCVISWWRCRHQNSGGRVPAVFSPTMRDSGVARSPAHDAV